MSIPSTLIAGFIGLASCGYMGARILHSLWLIEVDPHRGGSISLRPVMGLLRNIGFDGLVGDVAAAAAKVAPRLDMASPKALPHMRKFGQQTIGAFAFHPLDQATDRDVRWDRDHHMDMVWRDMPLEDIDA